MTHGSWEKALSKSKALFLGRIWAKLISKITVSAGVVEHANCLSAEC